MSDEGLCTEAGPGQLMATWEELQHIVDKQQGCYSLYDDGSKPWHISTISKSTGIPASLCPPLVASGAPTMVLGGFTMHRIAGDNMNPMVDTAAKLSCLRFFDGASVLDTCMGLGYTAIGAARSVTGTGGDGRGRVVTIEYDEASVEMAAHNPWSKQLFDGSLPIEVMQVINFRHFSWLCTTASVYGGNVSPLLIDPPRFLDTFINSTLSDNRVIRVNWSDHLNRIRLTLWFTTLPHGHSVALTYTVWISTLNYVGC